MPCTGTSPRSASTLPGARHAFLKQKPCSMRNLHLTLSPGHRVTTCPRDARCLGCNCADRTCHPPTLRPHGCMANYTDSTRISRTLPRREQKLLLEVTVQHRAGHRDHVM